MPSKPRRHPPPSRQGSTAVDRTQKPSQALFRGMFDNASVGIYWSTPDGQLLIANQELARILGYDSPKELLDLDLERDVYMRPADRRRLVALYTGHVEPQTAEAEWKRKDGAPIWVQIRARTVRESRNRPLYFESFVLDITRRKRAEEELRVSQERFARVFQASPAAVVIARSKDGEIVDVNRAWTELFGWTRDEAVGRTSVQLGVVKAEERAERRKLLERDGRVHGADWRVTTKSGEVRDVLFSVELLELVGEPCMIALSVDVTDRKRAEQALRDSEERLRLLGEATLAEAHRVQEELRELAAQLQSTREDERKRLSRELHDELGQVLTALKIDLSHMRRALPASDTASLERLQGMKGLLDRATAETHRMATELRPAILDDLGLVSAVRWLVDDFTRRVGVPCELTMDDLQEPLPGDLATAVFRIVQEALTNIARHAAASHVEVRLAQDTRGITIRVSDDGKGMPKGTADREQHLGLLGLRERAAQLGGDVTVRSQRDRGTAVTARVPLPLP